MEDNGSILRAEKLLSLKSHFKSCHFMYLCEFYIYVIFKVKGDLMEYSVHGYELNFVTIIQKRVYVLLLITIYLP